MDKNTENLFCLPCDREAWKQGIPLECRFEFILGNATVLPATQTTYWRTLPFHFCCIPQVAGDDVCKVAEIADAAPLPIRNGELLFVPAGVPHRVSETGEAPSRICWWMHFRCRTLGGLDAAGLFDLPSRVAAADAGPFRTLLEALIRLPKQLNLQDSVRQQLLGNSFLSELIARGRPRSLAPFKPAEMERLRTVLLRLENSVLPIPNAELARGVNLSRSRFLEFFRSVTGTSPGKYHESERFRRACRLLLETSRPIGEIAVELGYYDVYHFSRRFKQNSGLSPSGFRHDYGVDNGG